MFYLNSSNKLAIRPGLVFTKGLRLKCGLKVETFVSAKFCLKIIFRKGDLAKFKIIK